MKSILEINKELCLGCGLCIQVCPQGAINLIWGKAEIDARRCNSCYQCLNICPQGAIFEMTIISPAELRTTVSNLRQQTGAIMRRIDSLVSRA
ncbi:MAG: DUF362 domain-containing protein [Dehalococcoidia bacterium]